MSYRVNSALGYQKWGVTNPWVFANYGQPQRQRGRVSPMVFQTSVPALRSAHLGLGLGEVTPATLELLLEKAEAERARGERMERYAMAGVAISAAGLVLAYMFNRGGGRQVVMNRRRRRRTSRARR